MAEDSDPFERFCLVLAQIPKGKVCSYGHLARLASIGHARQACYYLRKIPSDTRLPWHRIVNAQGKISDFSHASTQKKRLISEGVEFTKAGRIAKTYFID